MPKLIAALLLLLLTLPAPVISAQNSSALINEHLDDLIKLDIKNQTMPAALQTITQESKGVRIDVAPEVWALLPWGEQTTINAKIENQTLRGALTAITRKLGLTFELKDEAVEIQPLPALRRLGRRATVEELSVLDWLARTPFKAPASATMRDILAAVDAQLQEGNTNFAIENRYSGGEGINIAMPRGATVLEALEMLPRNSDATWYPWGTRLVVVSKADQIRNQLSKTVTIRFNGVNVSQVFSELQARAGVNVKFAFEPGAVARIPPDAQTIRLVLENASIEQALEHIAGFTGLKWTLTNDGVYISNPAAAGVAQREPGVALLTLDNGVQVILRESQVTPEMREYLKHKTDQHLAKIRQMMEEEGFKPTTKPATAPANQGAQDL